MKSVVTLDDVQDDVEQVSKKKILSFLIFNPAATVSVLREHRQQGGRHQGWGGSRRKEGAAPMEGDAGERERRLPGGGRWRGAQERRGLGFVPPPLWPAPYGPWASPHGPLRLPPLGPKAETPHGPVGQRPRPKA